jgi:DNA-binding transcriptional LysR family regulator
VRIDDVRTFLEVATSGSFSAAANRLHVTQSTVSARIHALEEELDRPLFVRGRAGARLSAAGTQFERYAVTLVQAWQQARQEVALPEGFRTWLGLGTQVSLWQRLVPRWIPWIRERLPDVALRVEANYSDTLMDLLTRGLIDIGVMYGPRAVPGYRIETLLEEKLIMVSTSRRKLADGWPEDYVYVDWGDLFRAHHSEAFPDVAPPITFGLGALGLSYILDQGGTGYFPTRVARPLTKQKVLHQVRGAPTFVRPAYMVYRESAVAHETERIAIEGMRHAASFASEE